jgi:hypothetical protein
VIGSEHNQFAGTHPNVWIHVNLTPLIGSMRKYCHFVLMVCFFAVVAVVASVMLERALCCRDFGTDRQVTGSGSTRRLYPSILDVSNDDQYESWKVGLQLHSNVLWRPDKGSTHSEHASSTEEGPTKDATQAAPVNASDESKCKSSDLSDEHAPWHKNWDNSVAVCATMRHENITDVVEWLSYYKYVPICFAKVYKSVHRLRLGQQSRSLNILVDFNVQLYVDIFQMLFPTRSCILCHCAEPCMKNGLLPLAGTATLTELLWSQEG